MTTKQELQVDLQVLHAAREHIELGHYRHVCNAIEKSSVELTGSEVTSTRLHAWIKSMLNGYATLETWLRKKDHASEWEVNSSSGNPELRAKMQATRLAWLDWMIEQCERDYDNHNT